MSKEKIATGTLYMVPVPIAEGMLGTLAPEVAAVTGRLTYYFAEDARTARRFLRALHPDMVLETVAISGIDKHVGPDLALLRQWLLLGHDVGVMSEAGCPAIVDPGSLLVAEAHKLGATVVPLVGPSSILLALMASGLNGQKFCFQGYLPIKDGLLEKRIRELEQQSVKEGQTQIFIETPYRNNHMMLLLLKACQSTTKLCVAQSLTAPDAFVATKTVAAWAKSTPDLGKKPTVFLFLA